MIKKNVRFKILSISKTNEDFHNSENQLVEWSYTYSYVAKGQLIFYNNKTYKDKEVNIYIKPTTLKLLKNVEYTSDNFTYNEKFNSLSINSFEPTTPYWDFQLYSELYKAVPYEFQYNPEGFDLNTFTIYDKNIYYDGYSQETILSKYLPMFMELIKQYSYIGFDFLLNFFHYYAFQCVTVMSKDEMGHDNTIQRIHLPGGKYSLNAFLQDPYFSSIVSLYSFQDLSSKIKQGYPLKSISLIHEIFLQAIKIYRTKGFGVRYFSDNYSSYLTVKEVHTALNKTVKVSLNDTEKYLKIACAMGLLISLEDKYFLSEVYNKEKYVAEKMNKMYRATVKNKIPNELIDKFSHPIKHGDGQRNAIMKIAGNKTGVEFLIGGAGTGKTATAKTIVTCFEKLYNINKKKMLFLAPTAKAKGVLAGALDAEAFTVKKALLSEYFDNYDLILIDECGVLSLFDFYEILIKIKPHHKVIFLGDKFQLASIEFGTVLRDIEEKSDVIKVNELTEVYRQGEGSPIINLSVAIREQSIKATHLQNNGSLLIDNIDNLEFFIQDILDYQLKFFDNFENIQIITPTSRFKDMKEYEATDKFSLSGDNINKHIQSYRKRKIKNLKSIKYGNQEFLMGDKVMHKKNETYAIPIEEYKGIKSTNTNLGIENSDMGRIVGIDGHYIYVKYELGKIIRYTTKGDTSNSCLSAMNLTVAYAITIMKSQGSEWDTVIFLFDDNLYSKKGLSLNMLYTAVTRPKVNLIMGYNFIYPTTVTKMFQEAVKKTAFKSTRSHLFIDKM